MAAGMTTQRSSAEAALLDQRGTSAYAALLSYLKYELDVVKERMIDESNPETRGQAQQLRKLIKMMTRDPIKTSDKDDD